MKALLYLLALNYAIGDLVDLVAAAFARLAGRGRAKGGRKR